MNELATMTRQKALKRACTEEDVQKALDDIKSGVFKSAYAAEKGTGISRVLLSRRLKGTQKSRAEAHENEQLLTRLEEEALVKWTSALTIAGYPARHHILREMAEEIRTQRVASVNTPGEAILVQYSPIGINWTARFLERHPQLVSIVSEQLDLARWKDPTREVLETWFDVFCSKTAPIPLNNIYNMDETGFGIGTKQCSRVIVDYSTLRTRYKAHPGRQEWVSVVECVCADGSTIPLLFIFKGEGINRNILPSDRVPTDWCFTSSSTGWTSNIHGLEWLQRCFDPATKEKAQGKPRVLFCDGHDSHITGNFISYCMAYNIILLVMPPHTSHLLQPLDLSIFGPLKTYLGRELDRFTQSGISRIQKHEWVTAYCHARPLAMQSKNIASGFKHGGLIPFAPSTVYRQLPPEPTLESESNATIQTLETGMQDLFITTTPSNTIQLRKTNQHLKKALSSRRGITSPMKQYINKLADASERMNA